MVTHRRNLDELVLVRLKPRGLQVIDHERRIVVNPVGPDEFMPAARTDNLPTDVGLRAFKVKLTGWIRACDFHEGSDLKTDLSKQFPAQVLIRK
jgi:hypothetical protein